jgi:hypothetical protein
MQILRTTTYVDFHGQAQLLIVVLEGEHRTTLRATFTERGQVAELAEKLRLVAEVMR